MEHFYCVLNIKNNTFRPITEREIIKYKENKDILIISTNPSVKSIISARYIPTKEKFLHYIVKILKCNTTLANF